MPTPRISRTIDGRALEPPEPLVLTLDALETLGAHEQLLLLLDREPLPLYHALASGGHAWQTRRGADGSFEVLIWRKSD
ncbi:MAG: DUF2249 domain-containing protein [Rhodoferax sp.]|nr:DUF2249 domain-containing protein [Rhodoferax sp.]